MEGYKIAIIIISIIFVVALVAISRKVIQYKRQNPAIPTPNPAITAPNPAIPAPNPAITSPNPAITSPNPAIPTPNPAITTPNPAITTPNPAITVLNPAITSPNPAITAPNLAITAPNPAITVLNPAIPAPNSAISTIHEYPEIPINITYNQLYKIAKQYFIDRNINDEVIKEYYKFCYNILKDRNKVSDIINLFIVRYMSDTRNIWYLSDNPPYIYELLNNFSEIGYYNPNNTSIIIYNKNNINEIPKMNMCPWSSNNKLSNVNYRRISCKFMIGNKMLYEYICDNMEPEKIIQFYLINILQYLRLYYITDILLIIELIIIISGDDDTELITYSNTMRGVNISDDISKLRKYYNLLN